MKILDLFSGIGGFSLAADWMGWETVAFCERESFPRKVLAKNWPDVPIHDDVRKIEEFTQYAGTVELICGGFPCQPFSASGKQKSHNDDRYLWPAMFEIIKAVRPRWVIAENVAGIVKLALDDVSTDLEREGYTVQSFNIPARAVNATHKRERIWIVAYSDEQREQVQTQGHQPAKQVPGGQSPTWGTPRPDIRSGVEPVVCGDPYGVPAGVDRSLKIPNRNARIKSLGNAIVPQVAYQIFKAIEQAESEMKNV